MKDIMIEVKGLGGISAKVIADSISEQGVRLTTFEFVFPRFILSEVNTHRMLSKNAASSRAVPVGDAIAAIESNPAMPIHWGVNNPGMVSKQELDDTRKEAAISIWEAAVKNACAFARVASDKLGINGHKQWVNRTIETYSFTKQVITGTEWANFFWLRYHPDAQPEFQELARCAKEAMELSIPNFLKPGEWHLPYITVDFDDAGIAYWLDKDTQVDLETAKQISASCCAQVSYRKLDDSVEKAKKIFGMLNIGSNDKPQHVSPIEHQASPMQECDYPDLNNPENPATWEDGITHMRRDFSLWSGNLRGWIQYRQLVPGEARW